MRLLVACIVFAAFAAYCEAQCDLACRDWKSKCATKANCSLKKWKKNCPATCGKCTPCTLDAIIAATSSAIESSGGSSSSGSAVVESAPVADDGYKLILRHSADELTMTAFDYLWIFGTTKFGSFQNNAAGSQFRDPSLHFFWPNAEEARLDIYNANNQVAAYIVFKFPVGNAEHPSYAEWNQVKYVSDSSYTDIVGSESIFWYWSAHTRAVYIAKNHGGCQNDKFWFMLHDAPNGVCIWDQFLMQPVTGKTSIFYSPLNVAALAQSETNLASKFELSIKGPDLSSATGGFRRVFRYPANAGVNFMDYYESGQTDPTKDRSQWNARYVKTNEMFRDGDFNNVVAGASQVMMNVIALDGTIGQSMVFNGNGNAKTWMAQANLISTSTWKFDETNFFGIDGDAYWGRYVYLSRRYCGCDCDEGWLAVTCFRDVHIPCLQWDDWSDGNGEGQAQMCGIFYSPNVGHVRFADDLGTRRAQAIEIWVR